MELKYNEKENTIQVNNTPVVFGYSIAKHFSSYISSINFDDIDFSKIKYSFEGNINDEKYKDVKAYAELVSEELISEVSHDFSDELLCSVIDLFIIVNLKSIYEQLMKLKISWEHYGDILNIIPFDESGSAFFVNYVLQTLNEEK